MGDYSGESGGLGCRHDLGDRFLHGTGQHHGGYHGDDHGNVVRPDGNRDGDGESQREHFIGRPNSIIRANRHDHRGYVEGNLRHGRLGDCVDYTI